jgi:hypothetical protein
MVRLLLLNALCWSDRALIGILMLRDNWLFIYNRHYATVVSIFLLRLFRAFGSAHAKTI